MSGERPLRVTHLDHMARLSGAEIALVRLLRAADVARYIQRLGRRLRELGPDLVHTTSLKASVYGTIAARAVRLPLLWHLHDRLAADYLPPAVVPPMRLFAATAPSALVAPSRFTLRIVGSRFRRG